MDASTKANNVTQLARLITCEVGQLRALILQEAKDDWQLAIVRADEATGEFDLWIPASEVVSLAELVTLVASALHHNANLDESLSDDLGCLSHDLAGVLGFEPPALVHKGRRKV